MKTIIIFGTQNSEIVRFILRYKESLIPQEYRSSSFQMTFSVVPIRLDAHASDVTMCGEIIRITEGFDAVIAIWDSSAHHFIPKFSQSLFNVMAQASFDDLSRNLFGAIFAKAIKEFSVFSCKFDNLKYRKAFLLPLKNFLAEEIPELVQLIGMGNRTAPIGNYLSEILVKILRRQAPKKFSLYKQVYLVDNVKHYFEFGHEEHSQAETKVPPHNMFCALNSYFRFGRRYDRKQHFNVTKERPCVMLECTFINCHEEFSQIQSHTHVNMFPNGCF